MRDSYAPFRPAAFLEELKTPFGNSGKRFPKGTRALTRQAMFSAMRSMVTLAVIGMGALPCSAQFNSSIRGVVQDPAGAAIVGAKAILTNVGTNISTSAVTDSAGAYDFRSLPAGEYRLQVQATGFANASIHSILQTDESLNVPVKMVISGSATIVDVQSEAPLLDTADSRIQTTLPQNQIDSLPMQGRTVISLISLAPGVTGLGLASGSPPDNFNVETTNNVTANGRGFDGNLYVVDGLDITSSVRPGVINTSPNPDSVQEVAIQTNTYSVEYGRAGSIQTAISTKSGTNRIHGSASYYYTSQQLWTRSEFVSKYAPFHYNNIAGTIGGPVIKEHTFFFASVEPLRSLTTASAATTFESPEFVQFAKQNDPNSIGTSLLNKYPVSKATFTSVAKTAQAVFGATCGTPATQKIPCSLPVIDNGNYSLSPYRNGTQWSVRIDQNFSHDRIYGSYYNTSLSTLTASPRQGMDLGNSQTSRSGQVNETHTFSPRMLNEAAFGYLQIEGIAGTSGQFDVPISTIQGQGTGVGVGPAGQDFIQHNYHWRDTFNLVRGRHNLRMGFEGFHGDELTLFATQYSQPSFVFTNLLNFVTDNPFSEGNIYYNPLTGLPRPFSLGVSSTTYGFFVQDEWQVTPRFTLLLGGRFDNFGNPYPSKALGSVLSNFILGTGSDQLTQVSNGGLKSTSNVYNSSPKAFTPRVGVAWDPTGRGIWAVRGGIGLYHDWFTNGELTVPLRSNLPVYSLPTFLSTQGTKPIFSVGTSATYPFGYILPTNPPSVPDSHGGVVGQQNSIGGTDPNLKEPSIVNYTIGVERQLGHHLVAGVNYAGSRAYNLPEGNVSTINANNDVNRVAGNLIANNNVLVRPNQSFGAINYTKNGNQSSYNAFIATLTGRFGSRDTFQTSYTRSEAYDYGQQYPDANVDISQYRGPTAFNVPNRFSLSESIELPSFKKHNLVVKTLAGGWVVSGAVILESGQPFTVLTTATFQPTFDSTNHVNGLKAGSGDYNGDGYNYDFPNAPANGYSQPTDRQSYLHGLFPASAFPIPTIGTEGNEKRNLFTGPGYANTDMGLLKNISVKELARLQLRCEFFNLFNRPNLSGFINDLSNSQFGKATATFNPRYIQLGAKVSF
jgi:Carboxypeptidase regulatory-like domain/TonB dependent receptor